MVFSSPSQPKVRLKTTGILRDNLGRHLVAVIIVERTSAGGGGGARTTYYITPKHHRGYWVHVYVPVYNSDGWTGVRNTIALPVWLSSQHVLLLFVKLTVPGKQ